MDSEHEPTDETSDTGFRDDLDLVDPDLVVDYVKPMSLAEARRSLPPRPEVDKLLSVYFNAGFLRSREYAMHPILSLY